MAEQTDIMKKRKKAIIFLLIIFAPLIFMCLFVNFLAFGPPQSCKLVYLAQRNGLWILWDGVEPPFPKDYTGNWIHYFKNGQKKSEGEFINGRKEGKHVSWQKDGKKRSEGNYHKGTPIGKLTHWYNGKLNYEVNYDNNSLKHGLEISYLTGKMRDVTKWEHGKCLWRKRFDGEKDVSEK